MADFGPFDWSLKLNRSWGFWEKEWLGYIKEGLLGLLIGAAAFCVIYTIFDLFESEETDTMGPIAGFAFLCVYPVALWVIACLFVFLKGAFLYFRALALKWWWHKALKQGDSIIQNLQGVRYASGEGVPRNYELAVEWWRKAAEQGNPQALHNLGRYFNRRQDGVTRDKVLAYMYYTLASESGELDWRVMVGYITPEQIAEAQKLSREWKPKG
ncbi:sel1 repeat family protein [Verrucomicrobiales bacterium]|nr:sel1 repeat family protein [Verrucomicrobiales bacterium]